MSVQSGRLLEETYNLEFKSQDVVVFDFQADISGVDTNSLQDQDRSQARGEMWLWFYTPGAQRVARQVPDDLTRPTTQSLIVRCSSYVVDQRSSSNQVPAPLVTFLVSLRLRLRLRHSKPTHFP